VSTNRTPKQALIKGAAWTVAMRWSVKGLGFLNTVIMARILLPADYGIVAMAFLVVNLIQSFLDFGATTALLRKSELVRSEIDSAWTLRFIQGIVIGLLLILGAPLAALYFQESRVESVLWVFGLCTVASSASNIGPILAQKEFNFLIEFKIRVLEKLVSVIFTVGTGFLFHDYRALVIGCIAGYLTPLVMSYLLHPYRPRWDISKIAEIWTLTKWLMFAGVGGFILRQGDQIVAGRIGTTAQFGQYNVGADLGQLPVGEVGPAMLRALLPVLASIQDDNKRTLQAAIKTLAALNTIIWPIGIGTLALSTQLTDIILGTNWLEASTYVGAFAVISVLQTMLSPLNTLLILKGHTRSQMHIVWLEFAGFAIAAIFLVPSLNLVGLIYSRIAGNIVALIATITYSKLHSDISLVNLLAAIWRPIIGAGLMYTVVISFDGAELGLVAKTFFSIIFGAIFFVIWCISTWHFTGRSEGLESTFFDYFGQRRKK
jgi:lipopolysaccharide exporter